MSVTFELEGVTQFVCGSCGLTGPTMLRCSKCKLMRYCTKECQRKHWPEHKNECVTVIEAPVIPPAASEAAETPAKTVAADHAVGLPVGAAEFYGDEAVPLTLTSSPALGRHLNAKYDLDPGDIVLAAEAYAVVVSDPFLRIKCHRCLMDIPAAKQGSQTCTGCRFATYCSPACKARDGATHAHICSALRGLAASGGIGGDADMIDMVSEPDTDTVSTGTMPWGYRPDDIIDNETIRLTLVILAKKQLELSRTLAEPKPARGVHHKWTFADVFDLESHMADAPVPPRSGLARAARHVLTLLGQPKTIDSVNEVCGILLRIKYNAFPIKPPMISSSLGTGIFPSAAYLNHSCVPTVSLFADVSAEGEWRLICRSTRPVARGEQATIAYIETFDNRESINRTLQAGYRFRCKCEVCDGPGCPNHLLSAFKCPNCSGPLLPNSSYHPAIAASGMKCSCRSALKRSMSASDLSGRKPSRESLTAPHTLLCLVCCESVADTDYVSALNYANTQLTNASNVLGSNPAACLIMIQETLASPHIKKLHDYHQAVFSLRMLACLCGRTLNQPAVVVEHAVSCLHALQAISQNLNRIATIAVMYAEALVATRAPKDTIKTIMSRAASALKLCYGEDHPLVDSFCKRHRAHL